MNPGKSREPQYDSIFKKFNESIKPLSPYDLQKETSFPYSRVHEICRRLSVEGYIQSSTPGKSKKGLTKTFYSISFKGVLKYISSIDENQSDLTSFMEKQAKDLKYVPFQEYKWLEEHYPGIAKLFKINAAFVLHSQINSSGRLIDNINKDKIASINELISFRSFENISLRAAFGKAFLQNIYGWTVLGKVKGQLVNPELKQFAEKIYNEKNAEYQQDLFSLNQAIKLFQ